MVIGDANNIEQANQNFVNAIVTAAKQAQVQFYESKEHIHRQPQLDKLLQEKSKKERQLQQEHTRETDRGNITARLEEIKKEIQNIHFQDRERTERRKIEEIKINPKAFFKYANSSKVVHTKTGPLKTGDTYTSGPKNMAEILSQQYKSIISSPRKEQQAINMQVTTVIP